MCDNLLLEQQGLDNQIDELIDLIKNSEIHLNARFLKLEKRIDQTDEASKQRQLDLEKRIDESNETLKQLQLGFTYTKQSKAEYLRCDEIKRIQEIPQRRQKRYSVTEFRSVSSPQVKRIGRVN